MVRENDGDLSVEQLDRLIAEYYDTLASASDDCVEGIIDTIAGLEEMRVEAEKREDAKPNDRQEGYSL